MIELSAMIQKIENIKSILSDLTGNEKIEGNLSFSKLSIQFIIPPPFGTAVRTAARRVGFSIIKEGILLKANSIKELDILTKKIEDFGTELVNISSTIKPQYSEILSTKKENSAEATTQQTKLQEETSR